MYYFFNGIPVTARARLLGHSVETNIKHYSYARIGVDQEIIDRLNGKVAPELLFWLPVYFYAVKMIKTEQNNQRK